MSTPWLTVITITKDDPDGLRRTLASLADWRERAGVEQIVVHAGAESVAPPVNVRTIRQEGHGIAAAFNDGLRAARGEWVWFINGGDALHGELSADFLEALLTRSRADLVIGCVHVDGDAEPRELPPLREQWPLLHSWPPHPAALVRREALLRAGGFSGRYRACMDFELWHNLLGSGARADLISIPFARFDRNGLSSRPESAGLLFRENGSVLWRYQGAVWRSVWRSLRGLLLAWLRALRHRLS